MLPCTWPCTDSTLQHRTARAGPSAGAQHTTAQSVASGVEPAGLAGGSLAGWLLAGLGLGLAWRARSQSPEPPHRRARRPGRQASRQTSSPTWGPPGQAGSARRPGHAHARPPRRRTEVSQVGWLGGRGRETGIPASQHDGARAIMRWAGGRRQGTSMEATALERWRPAPHRQGRWPVSAARCSSTGQSVQRSAPSKPPVQSASQPVEHAPATEATHRCA